MTISKRVLIMIPAYNEAKAIDFLVREINRLYPSFDIVVINDGSTDATEQLAESAGANVITLPINLGIGGAIQTGFRYAAEEDYDCTVQVDGDAQHDPASLLNVVNPIINDQVDLCIGSRFLAEGSGFKSTYMRRIGIRFFARLLGNLTGIPLTDPTAGYRATGKKLIKEFANYYPIDFPEPEAIKIAQRFRARITEVPVKMRKRLGGISSIRYFSTIYYMIKVTFAILLDCLKKSK